MTSSGTTNSFSKMLGSERMCVRHPLVRNEFISFGCVSPMSEVIPAARQNSINPIIRTRDIGIPSIFSSPLAIAHRVHSKTSCDLGHF